jgi:hypothetical protein
MLLLEEVAEDGNGSLRAGTSPASTDPDAAD